ncbi:MAG: chromosome segregation protein SMC [Bacteroidia bacterium]|nr:chromosome segregation protein SMC [Bacteroidia bacterium]MBP7714107.1 chromosome segregation protein SMC [Bacteroidia bacterium]HQW17159.1 chromosome segregation protein SMC [Bacteroidia bacterium]HQW49984.1 chromosome segregation protein SMC [Bacteroidia bacterium]HQX70142.1 chromosome segregation protein SMC [Bacteroidia bacterium]
MRLSSLEIKGFKSFGDRVIIHFDKGVTSVVGPNGSGKSNVVDAMRWVLGEQKMRMLRSEKMENIIFNGTKTRKPANLAEVSLTFVNDKGILPVEFTTVCVTRRLYRSGDSEYLLNGVTCRLKDITDLFLNTGIGSDTYSIIELKMVDDIINDRHNTIKMLLEEASGISKYKIRKKQTLQKLEETDADLNRVNDLLFEIEKSLKQLEYQAKKTEKYYRLKEEYKVVSTALAWFLMREFTSTIKELTEKEQKQSEEKNNLGQQLENLEQQLSEIKIVSEERQQALGDVQKLLNEKLFLINKYENEHKGRIEKLNYLNEKKLQLEKQGSSEQTQALEIEKQIAQAENEKISEEAKTKELENEIQSLKSELESSRKNYDQSVDELRQLNLHILQVRQSVNDHETFIAVRQTRINSLNDQMKRLGEQIDKDRISLQNLEGELSMLAVKKDQAEKESHDKKQSTLQLDSEITQHENAVKELREKLADERRNYEVKNNEYQLTRNLAEKMEGFPESIKFLKKNSDSFKDIPLLSDIINCDEQFKVAIENYLEPFLSHFIVQSNEQAWNGLNKLSSEGKGRAHFFILDSFTNYHQASTHQIDGCIAASSVIENDGRYHSLMNYLLANVYIAQNSDVATQANQNEIEGKIILSPDGKFYRQRYSISGGSVGSYDGKRTGRLKHLEKLSAEIQQHQQQTEVFKIELQQTEELLSAGKTQAAENRKIISLTDSELSKAVLNINTLLSKKDFITSNCESNEKNLQKLQEELQLTQEQKNNAPGFSSMSLDEMKINLQKLTDQQREKQNQSGQLQKISQEASNAFNQKNITFLQQQNKVQNIIREIGYKNNQVVSLKSSVEKIKTEIEQLHEQINDTAQAGNSSETDLKTQVEEKVLLESRLGESEKNYFEAKGKIDQFDKQIAETRRKREMADELMHALHNEVSDVNLKMTSLKERLSVEFSLEVEDIVSQEANPEWNEEDLKARNEKLGGQLKNFGPINPMALDSFKEIKERYDFIIKEQDDLKKAKDALLQTIAEIDNSAKEKFSEVFNQVRNNFINVFRSLFTADDNCDMILADTNNPLESDIEIIAQPKGKKPLSIQQLSGGERTLTATALLFGLYLVKPAPFCIFDEVDAPLDDNNIDKFNNIIKKFSKDSQFIIITHNKKTMAATDIIYGITMNEPGVTAVVPVDLREYDETLVE